MLYWLLYQKLYPFFHPFRIFRYLTFRTAFASGTALLIALFIGPYVIQKLREFQIGQYIREDGPAVASEKIGHADHGRRADRHRHPAAHGVVVRSQPIRLSGSRSFPRRPYGAIGFADDYIKVVKRRNLGLTARAKLVYQALAAAGSGDCARGSQQFKLFSTQLNVPFHQGRGAPICCGTLAHARCRIWAC